jgi:uncharacterized protein YjeT (DUF2065 family)
MRLAHLGCAIVPTDNEKIRLVVTVNNVKRAETEVAVDIGGVTNAKASFGADDSRSFALGDIVLYDRPLSDRERWDLHLFLCAKHKTLPRINEDHLLEADRRARQQFPEANVQTRGFMVAVDVLDRYLGSQWVRDNILSARPIDSFFKLIESTPLDHNRHMARVTRLAEALYHFQSTPGLASHVEDLKKHSVEAVAAELQGAFLLCRAGLPVVFQIPTLQKGDDFDLLIEGSEPTEDICCEIKCKLSSTNLSEATMLDSLKSAASQLPKGRPGLVMMKLPDEWAREPSIATLVADALRRFFGGSTRVGLVVLYWEEWFEAGNNFLGAIRCQRQLNPRSPHRDLLKARVGEHLGQRGPGSGLSTFAMFLQARS